MVYFIGLKACFYENGYVKRTQFKRVAVPFCWNTGLSWGRSEGVRAHAALSIVLTCRYKYVTKI